MNTNPETPRFVFIFDTIIKLTLNQTTAMFVYLCMGEV